MATFNFYVNNFLAVSNYCGTITVTTSGSSGTLVYTPGGPCTAGAGDQVQSIPLNVSGTSFTGGALTIGGVAYTAISGGFSSTLNGWSGSLTPANGNNVTWQSLSAMAFPYGQYLFLVYGNGPRAAQLNNLGGIMVLSGHGDGTENVQLTIGGVVGNGTCNSASSHLNFGQCVPGPTVAIPGGATYTFQQLRYAFTSTDGRAVLWGNLQISGQTGSVSFVGIQWPALALPGPLGWIVQLNLDPSSPRGSINFTTMQYTNPGGQSFAISQPSPQFTFTDTSTTPPMVFTGLPQVTIEGPGGSTNPSSHPSRITWNFGGSFAQPPQQHSYGPPAPGDEGSWDSVAQVGQLPGPDDDEKHRSKKHHSKTHHA